MHYLYMLAHSHIHDLFNYTTTNKQHFSRTNAKMNHLLAPTTATTPSVKPQANQEKSNRRPQRKGGTAAPSDPIGKPLIRTTYLATSMFFSFKSNCLPWNCVSWRCHHHPLGVYPTISLSFSEYQVTSRCQAYQSDRFSRVRRVCACV